jgi:hypothetical protein
LTYPFIMWDESRLLHHHLGTGFVLLASDDLATAVWVDPSVCFGSESRPGGSTGAFSRYGGGGGLRSPWMTMGEVDSVLVCPSPLLLLPPSFLCEHA